MLLQRPTSRSRGTIDNEMDSTLSTTEAARALNTTLPRVHRSLSRLGIGTYDGHRRKLTDGDFKRLQADLGFVPDREDIGEKSCSFSQRFVNTRSACDLLVQWPESPESARQPLRAPLPPGEQGIRRLSGPASCRGRGQRGGAVEINWSSPAWRSVESDVRGTVLPPESPPDTLPHLHPSTSTISFGTSTARHSTSTVTVRSSRCASSAPWTSRGCRGWPLEPSRRRICGGRHGPVGSLPTRRTSPSTSPGRCDANPNRGQGHPAA